MAPFCVKLFPTIGIQFLIMERLKNNKLIYIPLLVVC